MAKTYVPTYHFILKQLYRYMTRYEVTIKSNLTSGQVTCFTSVLAAVISCLEALGTPVEGD